MLVLVTVQLGIGQMRGEARLNDIVDGMKMAQYQNPSRRPRNTKRKISRPDR
jgi:hypothetical protein